MRLLKERSADRPYHLGPYPFESLKRSDTIAEQEAASPAQRTTGITEPVNELAAAARKYARIFLETRDAEPAPGIAAVPDDLARRSQDVKGYCIFLDAAHVGIAKIPQSAWHPDCNKTRQQYTVIIVVEDGKMPAPGELAHQWLDGAQRDLSRTRSTEIALCLKTYIGSLGFSATVQSEYESDVDLQKLAVLAGVAARHGNEVISPYLGSRFSLAAVTTDYPLATDQPLAAAAPANQSFKYWRGINGAMSGREINRRTRRPLHLGNYPLESVKRVVEPTTLINESEVPRIPKRAEGFGRASMGDFGAKAQVGMDTALTKSPHNNGMMTALGRMVPYQNGEVAQSIDPACSDPEENAKAIKSLAYHMGADMVGICEVPQYAWYSHKADGTPIEPYHRYAVCMLIDQGFETMEGASGDDWISAAQSMRAYMRGGEIGGVLGEFMRGKGFAARSQTAADGDVLQIPLLLLAGLGELSRIGELVLNPFVGPRFKSMVLTTDMPLAVDKPIDFGLQYFCSNCLKCARECPCNAISYGEKVMFNGYEMWKPDVERCVSYRVTNPKGSMCGRCMKMCPLNKVPNADGPLAHRVGTWLGIHARWLKPLLVPVAVYLDDKLGYGKRNPKKKWWLDLEIIDEVAQLPRKGANERDLDFAPASRAARQKIAYYPASMMPPGDCEETYLADRKAALAVAEQLETPAQARARIASGGETPLIYFPNKGRKDTAATQATPGEADPGDADHSRPIAAIGRWKLMIKTPIGKRTPTLELVQNDSGVVGTVTDKKMQADLTNVSARANQIAFSAEIDSPMGKANLSFTGTVDGDRLTGKVRTPLGPRPFSGERLSE